GELDVEAAVDVAFGDVGDAVVAGGFLRGPPREGSLDLLGGGGAEAGGDDLAGGGGGLTGGDAGVGAGNPVGFPGGAEVCVGLPLFQTAGEDRDYHRAVPLCVGCRRDRQSR